MKHGTKQFWKNLRDFPMNRLRRKRRKSYPVDRSIEVRTQILRARPGKCRESWPGSDFDLIGYGLGILSMRSRDMYVRPTSVG